MERRVRARLVIRVGDREIEAVPCGRCPSWSQNLIAPPSALPEHIAKFHGDARSPAKFGNMVRGVSAMPSRTGRYRGGRPSGAPNKKPVSIQKIRGRNP